MRKLIAGMKISADGVVGGAEGAGPPWVAAWSDDYDLTPQIDACVLGAGMYPGYEGYWTAIQSEPDKPIWDGGPVPTPGEVDWARFAAHTPHYVLSRTLTSAGWPQTSFLRGLDQIAALKQQPGKDIYLIGGARTTAACIDAGLVDELRLIVYPVIAGSGVALFATTERRRDLELRAVEQLSDGRVSLAYSVG
jgi:dihydrofolate reductase